MRRADRGESQRQHRRRNTGCSAFHETRPLNTVVAGSLGQICPAPQLLDQVLGRCQRRFGGALRIEPADDVFTHLIERLDVRRAVLVDAQHQGLQRIGVGLDQLAVVAAREDILAEGGCQHLG